MNPPGTKDNGDPKIYLLPNLMTAGNLFCGFAATLRILEGIIMRANEVSGGLNRFREAILFILGACVFDLLDGRLARLGGRESPFGREFDSIADVVSFGLAPALLVHEIVLQFVPGNWALVLAFVYLCCGAMRLARFNCIAANPNPAPADKRSFKGLPIPAAAGVIASLTMFMLWIEETEKGFGWWRYGLPVLVLFLSWMMFSQFRYPSFKAVNWRTSRSVPAFIAIVLLLLFTAMNYHWMPFALFMAYLVYGFTRPFLSRAWRKEIEETIEGDTLDDEDEEEGPAPAPQPKPADGKG